MCTGVKNSATQEESQNFITRPVYQRLAQHLTDARQSAPDRGVYCKSTVDSLGSEQSLAYGLFLMDLVVHVCGSRLGGQDKIGHGN